MNQDHIAGIWQQVRGEIKEIVGTLANAPKLIAAGLRDQRIQHLGGQIGRVPARELAVAATAGGALGGDDEGFLVVRGVPYVNAARQLKEFHLRNRNWKLLGH